MDDARFRNLIAQGLLASTQGDGPEAIALYTQALQAVPGSGLPWFLIGSEHAAAGRLAPAEAAFADAVLRAPAFHLARYQLGLLQFSAGRPAAALVTWEPLQALPDDAPLGHYVRGFAALARADYDSAQAHYERGLREAGESDPVSADIRLVLEAVRALPRPACSPGAATTPHLH